MSQREAMEKDLSVEDTAPGCSDRSWWRGFRPAKLVWGVGHLWSGLTSSPATPALRAAAGNGGPFRGRGLWCESSCCR